MYALRPEAELAVVDWYEYGGGGPEYIFVGLARGAGMFKAAEIGILWL